MARVKKQKKVTRTPDTTKNWSKYFLIIALVIISIALLNYKPSTPSNSDEIVVSNRVKVPSVTIPIKEELNPVMKRIASVSLNDEELSIARNVVTAYFDRMRSNEVPVTEKIEDYVIHSVSGSKTENQVMLQVNYSVKPTMYGTYWATGNGNGTNDGWIRNNNGCTVLNTSTLSYPPVEEFINGCSFAE